MNQNSLLDDFGDFSDWFEVRNISGASINLDGWHATDDAGDLDKWTFPAVELEADEHLLVFASNRDQAVTTAPLHTNFRLSAGGEHLALVRPDLVVEHAYSPAFPTQFTDVSFGLSADPQTQGFFVTPTPGAPNTSLPVADPNVEVVINEIFYHPASGDPLEEYIELFNFGTSPVDLVGWQFINGVEFVFPSTSLAAGAYLVVAADVATFQTNRPGVTNVVGGCQPLSTVR